MKPLKLSFKGINSFSEETDIDFTLITKNGIFGIFGDTGSGKSTILDCINFALFGDVDRSKKKIDIINYNCDSAEVKFTFDILSGGARKTYIVERSIKRKSGLPKAMLYEIDGDTSLCIADNTSSVNEKIVGILSLNADDFRKCIALPQGEFSQFVQSAPSERFKLIERLFSLSKYGDSLKEKIAAKENEVDIAVSNAEGELSAYVDVNKEIIEKLSDEIQKDKVTLADCQAKYTVADEEYKRVARLVESSQELSGVEAKLNNLLAKKSSMEKLRTAFKALPLCKVAVEYGDKTDKKVLLKAKLNSDSIQLKKNADNLSGEIASLTARIESGDLRKSAEEQQTLLSKYEAYKDRFGNLKLDKARLDELRKKYAANMEESKKLAAREKAQAEKVEASQKAYDECSKANIKDFFDNNFKHSVLIDEYKRQIAYFGDLRESIKIFEKDTELYGFVRDECTQKIKEYEGLILASVGEKIDVEKTIKGLQAATERREKLLKTLTDCKSALYECQQNCLLNANEGKHIKCDGEEVAARVSELEKSIIEVFGNNTDYDKIVAQCKANINRIKQQEDALNNLLDTKKKQLESLNGKLMENSASILAADAEIENLQQLTRQQVENSGCANLDECKKLLNEFNQVSNAEKELADYDNALIALADRKNNLLKITGISSVTQSDADLAKAKVTLLDGQIKSTHAEIKLKESKVEEISAKLVKKKEKEQALKLIREEKDLISQLKDLTRGNKLLEYIAAEYLCEISSIASVTLLKLTDGRYFLNYTDNFYVGDNFNCGNLRGVNTLSGGETFLVSLSLALALSTVICAGSNKSLEFFFLDEGFGTLDENLIETVMDSLEKLKSSSFTIGIISHVEELKHRIDSKIIVNKATESHGSTVTLSV